MEIKLQKIKDGRDGILCIAEAGKQIDFEIKRVFFIYNLNSEKSIRGKHAHKQLKQAVFCIQGKCTVVLNDGKFEKKIILDTPETGLFIDKMIWSEFKNFEDNSILLVFASDVYNEEDYIRNFEEFKRLKNSE